MNNGDLRQFFYKTLIVIGTVGGLYLLFELRVIVFLLFGAILFASTIRPIVIFLAERRVPQIVSILAIYILFILAVVSAVLIFLPTLFAHSQSLLSSQANFLQAIATAMQKLQLAIFNSGNVWLPVPGVAQMQTYLNQFQTDLQSQIQTYLFAGFTAVGEAVVLFVMAFYWLTERDKIEDLGLRMVPLRHRDRFKSIFNDIETTLGAFVRGQTVLCVIVGTLATISLTVLGVPSALLLGTFAGIAEAIPMVGPIIGATPAILVTLLYSPEKALVVALVFLLIQQFEAQILVPKVMERQVGLTPLLVIVAITSGGLLGGILGALIAIPIAGAVRILVRDLIIEPSVQAHKPQVVQGAVLFTEEPAAPPPPSELVITPPTVPPGS